MWFWKHHTAAAATTEENGRRTEDDGAACGGRQRDKCVAGLRRWARSRHHRHYQAPSGGPRGGARSRLGRVEFFAPCRDSARRCRCRHVLGATPGIYSSGGCVNCARFVHAPMRLLCKACRSSPGGRHRRTLPNWRPPPAPGTRPTHPQARSRSPGAAGSHGAVGSYSPAHPGGWGPASSGQGTPHSPHSAAAGAQPAGGWCHCCLLLARALPPACAAPAHPPVTLRSQCSCLRAAWWRGQSSSRAARRRRRKRRRTTWRQSSWCASSPALLSSRCAAGWLAGRLRSLRPQPHHSSTPHGAAPEGQGQGRRQGVQAAAAGRGGSGILLSSGGPQGHRAHSRPGVRRRPADGAAARREHGRVGAGHPLLRHPGRGRVPGRLGEAHERSARAQLLLASAAAAASPLRCPARSARARLLTGAPRAPPLPASRPHRRASCPRRPTSLLRTWCSPPSRPPWASSSPSPPPTVSGRRAARPRRASEAAAARGGQARQRQRSGSGSALAVSGRCDHSSQRCLSFAGIAFTHVSTGWPLSGEQDMQLSIAVRTRSKEGG